MEFSPCGSIIFAPGELIKRLNNDFLAGHLELIKHNAFGTFVFRRSDFDHCRPCAFLPSVNPTIIVKCNPVIFELRKDTEENYLK